MFYVRRGKYNRITYSIETNRSDFCITELKAIQSLSDQSATPINDVIAYPGILESRHNNSNLFIFVN